MYPTAILDSQQTKVIRNKKLQNIVTSCLLKQGEESWNNIVQKKQLYPDLDETKFSLAHCNNCK